MAVNKNNVKIHISHLKKNFGKLEVLKDVSADICEGEVVVVLGPSGSGKSTLLRCLNRLEEITAGEVVVDGHDMTDKKTDLNKVRQNVGMVFQHFNLFNNLDVMGNMTLAPTELKMATKAQATEKALQLLERVGLLDKASAYPAQLSGGQKQRVAIVRALCMHPEILLLDEITAALDPEMVREVLEVVLSLARAGSTMVIVTHEMNFARAIANRILFIENGAVVEQSDDPKAFFASPKTDRAKAFLKSFDYDE